MLGTKGEHGCSLLTAAAEGGNTAIFSDVSDLMGGKVSRRRFGKDDRFDRRYSAEIYVIRPGIETNSTSGNTSTFCYGAEGRQGEEGELQPLSTVGPLCGAKIPFEGGMGSMSRLSCGRCGLTSWREDSMRDSLDRHMEEESSTYIRENTRPSSAPMPMKS